jgi:hypothetical protein
MKVSRSRIAMIIRWPISAVLLLAALVFSKLTVALVRFENYLRCDGE